MTEETADGIVKLMEMVEQDMRNDVNEYDGKPFDGRTMGEAIGSQCAAIVAIARSVKLLAKEIKGEK